MYEVIINKNHGFTEIKRRFLTIQAALNFAAGFSIFEVYKNKTLIYKASSADWSQT